MNRFTLLVLPVVGSLFVSGCGGVVEERYVVREPGAVVVADAPPPPREEIIVAAPSPRHHWERGRWIHRGRGWVWVGGRWAV